MLGGSEARSSIAAIFEDALKIDPTYPPALIGLAKALMESRTSQAESKCLQVLAINPNLIELMLGHTTTIKLDESYLKPTKEKLFLEFQKGITDLTVFNDVS